MREAKGPVLEVCCGNGRVLVPALEAGVEIEGLDLSPEMLAGLRAHLATRGFTATIHEADMRAFALPRRFALIVIAFNSFLHNLTQADQLATLRTCRAHLAPGGRLVLVIFHPAVDKLLQFASEETVMKDVPNRSGTGRVRFRDLCADDRIEQVRRVRRKVEFTDDAGNVERTTPVEITLRYVFKPEMELLLTVAGFTRRSVRAFETAAGAPWPLVERELREGDMLLWTAWVEA
jgi:SAM-dependent methyltransferase